MKIENKLKNFEFIYKANTYNYLQLELNENINLNQIC